MKWVLYVVTAMGRYSTWGTIGSVDCSMYSTWSTICSEHGVSI